MRALLMLAALAWPGSADEIFRYKAEWRLMQAGNIVLAYTAMGAHLTMETVGLTASLYRVNDDYRVQFRAASHCSESFLFQIEEGKKRNEARATFPAKAGKSSYVEVDTLSNETLRTAELDVPACVHDVISALAELRSNGHSKGAEFTMPVSDGRKFAQVKVRERGKERVKTEAGEFNTVKYEADLMNGVIYRRWGRMYFWLTDDARRVPVRIRMQMSFFFGTVTIDLVKEERS
ncbi:MAG: DUF3108 domain-containing protein [Acidobacteriota bacterium]